MKNALAQGWWAPLAAVLAVCNVVLGAGIIATEQNPGSIVGGTLFILGGIALAAGLVQRPKNRTLGTGLILFGAFWGLPIFWLVIPAILAIVVMVGVLSSPDGGRSSPA